MIKRKTLLQTKFYFLLTLLAFTAFNWGCVAAVVGGAAGAGAVMYSKGELKSTEKAELDEVWDAAIDALNSMQLDVISQDKNGMTAKLVAKAENGDNIDIKLEQIPNDLTEMKIRVGSFGNEDQARLIQQEIRERIS